MPALQNLTHQPAEAPFWEHSGRFTLRPRYQLSTIVTLDHLYFTSDVFQVILLYMVRVWDWWQSAKSVFLLSTINQAKFTKIHASQAAKSPCSKDCAVDLKDGCKLREQSLSIVLAQNLEKAHLPKTMKSPSFPVESYEFTLSNKNQSVFVLHRDFPCSMPALQNLTQAEAPFWEHSGRFTFRPRYKYNSDTWSSVFHFRCFSSHPFAHGMRLMPISKICVSAHKISQVQKNKQNSINPRFTGRQVTLLKRLRCWSQRWVQAAWAEFEHRFSTKPRKGTSAQNHEKSKFSSRKPWVYFEQQKSVRVCFAQRLSMFNASSSKSNSSWSTLLGALRQVHFQTSV